MCHADQQARATAKKKTPALPAGVVVGPSCEHPNGVQAKARLQIRGGVGIDVANHVEVVVVNVDHFDRFPIFQSVGHGVPDDGFFVKVNRALVVSVVQLCWSNQRIEPGRVDVIRDFLFDDANVVSLLFPKQWDTTFDGPRCFESVHHFVIAWRIECHNRATRSRGAENRYSVVPFLLPKLLFLFVLVIGTHWHGESKEADVVPVIHSVAAGRRDCQRRERPQSDIANNPMGAGAG